VGAAARVRGGLRRLPRQARVVSGATRARAILRRTTRGVTAPRRVGALAVDPQRVEARYAGTRIELARLEFALLCRLADDPLRVFTKHELLRDVWGFRAEPRTRTLDAHACRLRRKLGRAGAIGHVVNVRGVGYRLVDRVPELIGRSGLNGDSAAGGRTGSVQQLADAA
jgi:DNA-binding response OmpR family regulator